MERRDMVNVLHSLFTKGIEINLTDETFSIVKIDSEETTSCKNFSDWIEIFAEEGNVHPDDKERFLNFFNYSRLRKVFSAEKSGPEIIHYKRFAGANKWIEVTAYLVKSIKPNIILLGIMPTERLTNT